MTSIKGLFFDLDGTLVDTHKANFFAYRDAIKNVLAIDVSNDLKVLITQGHSSKDFLPKLIPGISEDVIARVNNEKMVLYPNYMSDTMPNDYLVSFLKQMSVYMQTALVTTAKRTNADAVLERHDLKRFFSTIIYGDDVIHMKPHPEAYLEALKACHLTASQVVAFEDSEKGIEAALAAGIMSVRVRDFEI